MKATIDDVRHAYRLLLGREPDEAGRRTYAGLIAKQPLAATDLAAIFLESDEFARMRQERGKPVRVDLDGYSVFVRSDDSGVGFWVLSDKRWEPHVTRKLESMLKPGMTFVDVGANVGYFTALAAHLVGSGGTVVAIEPMDKNVQLILAACRHNRNANVTVYPVVASDRAAVVAMNNGAGTSNGSVLSQDRQPLEPALLAQAIDLDRLLAPLRGLDVVKMDIEGFEPHAWKGFERTIAKFKPRVLTEYHPKCLRENGGVDPHDYLRTLLGYGKVSVLHENGTERGCTGVADVDASWASLDAELGADGSAHLDLYVEPP